MRTRNLLSAKPQAVPSESQRTLEVWALTVLLGYGLQIGDSNGLSRKKSLAMTKRPASTHKKLVMFVIRHNIFYKQITKVTTVVQRLETQTEVLHPGLPVARFVISGKILSISGLTAPYLNMNF